MQAPSSSPAPLPKFGPATSHRGEFALFGQLIVHARMAFVNRSEPYQHTLENKFFELALALGASAVAVCEKLAENNSYWSCVCARPYSRSDV